MERRKAAHSLHIAFRDELLALNPAESVIKENLPNYLKNAFELKIDCTKRLKLDNEVALEYYRLQKIAEGDLVLQVQGEHSLDPTTEAGISRPKDEKDKLSNIIKLLNDKFGTDFTEADRLYFEQIEQALFSFSFMPYSKNINEEKLFCDGYILRYGNKQQARTRAAQ
jgi:hypothetical protein